jgi:repressor LexA
VTFGARLRSARKLCKLTQKELAAMIGAAHNSISNWENDQNRPDPDTIELLCGALNVTPNYFFDRPSTDFLRIPNIMPLPKTKKVPLLGTIACGESILAEENIDEYIDMDESIDADFCLRCKGDSMINARINDGDIVYIRQQPRVDHGQIAAVLVDDEATLKRVYLYEDYITLKPENPAYEPKSYFGERMNDIRILGKAVAFTSLVK